MRAAGGDKPLPYGVRLLADAESRLAEVEEVLEEAAALLFLKSALLGPVVVVPAAIVIVVPVVIPAPVVIVVVAVKGGGAWRRAQTPTRNGCDSKPKSRRSPSSSRH